MEASPIIHMACLNPNEAWKLFESYSGVLESDSIRKIVEDVCKEYAGLPLAISVVASTLKHNKRKYMWSNFLSGMMESDFEELDGIEAKVYVPLKLSYDRLESDNQKLCFLFCSLFPEDYPIQLNDLMYYGLGEGFVTCREKVSTLERTLILIEDLKSRGLLLDVEGKDEMFVKMHDVVRDVAISIARNDKKLGFYSNLKDLTKWPEGGESETIKRISLMGNSITHVVDHNPKFHGKRMKSLFLNDNKYLKTIADDFFEEMGNLHILDMRGTDLDQSLPTSFQKLMKLRVFAISYYSYPSGGISLCDHLISKKNLVVLILRDSKIQELTKEFGELVHLKVLDIKRTTIDIIRPKVLSKLEKLEELGMFGSFNRWNKSDKDGNFMSFFELASLKCLYTLELQVVKFEISSKDVLLNFLSSLKFFTILLGKFELNDFDDNVNIFEDIFDHSYQKNNKILALSSSETFGTISNWIIVLMKKAEKLSFNYCNGLIPFRILPVESFKSLKMISIQNCEASRFIFLWNTAVCLVHLENLKVEDCSSLEVIVMKDNSDYYNKGQEPFPKLRKVELVRLQNLTSLWQQESEKIMELSSLISLTVFDCMKLMRLFFGEKSVPNLSRFLTDPAEYFDKLQWEDGQAENL